MFAPDNAAFAKIPPATLAKVLADKAELTKILTYHVAAGRYTPDQLAAGTTIKTLEGAAVTPGQMGGGYEVNDAHVVCGKRPDRQRHRVHHRHRADAPSS